MPFSSDISLSSSSIIFSRALASRNITSVHHFVAGFKYLNFDHNFMRSCCCHISYETGHIENREKEVLLTSANLGIYAE